MRAQTYHCAVCDKPDEGVGGQQAKADDNGVAQSLEVVFVQTSVDHEEEDWWYLRGTRQGVLDGGVFWEEFGGEVGVRDVLVMRGEGVPLQTERADPKLPADVDLALEVLAN